MRVTKSDFGLWFVVDNKNYIVKVCITKDSAISEMNRLLKGNK